MGVWGNERVDVLAKDGLLFHDVNFHIAPDISDLEIMIREIVINEWQVRWNTSTKGRFYYRLEQKVSETVKYSDPLSFKQTSITRLRFNKCLLGEINYLYKKKENPLCETCHLREYVSHF